VKNKGEKKIKKKKKTIWCLKKKKKKKKKNGEAGVFFFFFFFFKQSIEEYALPDTIYLLPTKHHRNWITDEPDLEGCLFDQSDGLAVFQDLAIKLSIASLIGYASKVCDLVQRNHGVVPDIRRISESLQACRCEGSEGLQIRLFILARQSNNDEVSIASSSATGHRDETLTRELMSLQHFYFELVVIRSTEVLRWFAMVDREVNWLFEVWLTKDGERCDGRKVIEFEGWTKVCWRYFDTFGNMMRIWISLNDMSIRREGFGS